MHYEKVVMGRWKYELFTFEREIYLEYLDLDKMRGFKLIVEKSKDLNWVQNRTQIFERDQLNCNDWQTASVYSVAVWISISIQRWSWFSTKQWIDWQTFRSQYQSSNIQRAARNLCVGEWVDEWRNSLQKGRKYANCILAEGPKCSLAEGIDLIQAWRALGVQGAGDPADA